MPPGPGKSVTELFRRGFDAPLPDFHGKQGHIARLARAGKWNVQRNVQPALRLLCPELGDLRSS